MATGDVLKRYVEQVRLIRGSNLATNERSYYPALGALFDAVSESLNPQVLAIHDVADAGAGHPDFTLQVKTTGDTRAVGAVGGAAVQSEGWGGGVGGRDVHRTPLRTMAGGA